MHFAKTHKALLIRLGIFTTLFLITSALLGKWIIPTPLLYKFHFFIYGNLGKVLLFSGLIFFILAKDQLNNLPQPKPYTTKQLLPLILSLLLIPCFYLLSQQLLTFPSAQSAPLLTLLTHLTLIAIIALQAIAIFTLQYIKQFTRQYQKPLLYCLGIASFSYISIFFVWRLWPFFSHGVLVTVKLILDLTHDNIFLIPPRTLIANNFAVEIAEACSGLDSLVLFSAFYIIIGIIERKRFNKLKYFLILPLALIGLYATNILRVLLLILIGIHISPELAIGLFHTYAGMILFLIYFMLFWKLSYKWLLDQK